MYLYIEEDGTAKQGTDAPDDETLADYEAANLPIYKFEGGQFFESFITSEEVEEESDDTDVEPEMITQYTLKWLPVRPL